MNAQYQYKPIRYFITTFLVTYVLWFIGAYFSYRDESGSYYLLMLVGLMTPFLISLWMIFTSNDSRLKHDFINRLTNPRLIQPKILPIFILVMPLSVIISIIISLLVGESNSQFQFAEGFSFSSGFVPVLLLLFLAAAFEELGWRGYAFDSLQSRYNYFRATIIFSILWSLWHFPLIFVKDSYQYEIYNANIWYAVNFFVGIVPMGIIISWICIKNGKSVIAAVLFHFIVNMSQEMMEISQNTKCIQTFVLTIVAGIIIYFDREMFFSKGHIITK